jgi:hypothetical protein
MEKTFFDIFFDFKKFGKNWKIGQFASRAKWKKNDPRYTSESVTVICQNGVWDKYDRKNCSVL